MDILTIILIIVGVVLLYYGGELLVDNAARLASFLGMSPLVIGLTIVAFGTSSPELLTSVMASFKDAPDVAMGNVVGSNIANLGLILGLSAIVFPLQARARFTRREVPFMIGVAVLLVPLSLNLVINRLEGILFIILLGIYLFVLFRDGEETAEVDEEFSLEYSEKTKSVIKSSLGIVLSILLLVGGAHSLVTGAVDLARTIGISERIIGLSLVALSTSLPELASSLVAARKHEGDILIGNIIGSNVFNILAVLGLTAIVKPVNMSPELIRFDLWAMVFVSALVFPFCYTQRRIDRIEGVILLLLYCGYIAFIYFYR